MDELREENNVPITPDVLINPQCFNFQIANFQACLEIPSSHGITGILRLGSDLYTCKLTTEEFLKTFNETKQDVINLVLQLVWPAEKIETSVESRKHYLDFKLKFLHIALDEFWRLPCLVVKQQNKLIWHTGSNRILATGISKLNKENELLLLCTDFDKNGTNNLIKDCNDIVDDQQLSELFGIDFYNYDQNTQATESVNCRVYLQWNGSAGPCLHYVDPVGRSFFDWQDHSSDVYADGVIAALQKIGKNKQIQVWAKDPKQVYDSSGIFSIKYQGHEHFEIPAEIGAKIYHCCMFDSEEMRDVTRLYVTDDSCIDLGEIILWLNTVDNIYVDHACRFALVLHSRENNQKTISASGLPKKTINNLL